MYGPKVVLIGAGSLFFGRQFIWAMIHSEALCNGTAVLVDTDGSRLDKMMRVAKMAIDSVKSPLKLEGTTNYCDVLKNADFVILSFANKGVHYRGVDCTISEKYGIRMCSGDTIGPGGIFRAMRDMPVILRIAKSVEELCPDAWVINYINPTAVNGIGLMRNSMVKSFALCDGLHMPHVRKKYMDLAGLAEKDPDKFDLQIAGVNHFTWLLSATYDGADVQDALRQGVQKKALEEKNDVDSKSAFNFTYGGMLWDIFGRYPVCMAHTKEYMPYWQSKGVLPDQPASLAIFNTEDRYKRHQNMWDEVDGYLSGKIDISEFHKKHGPDHATDIIETMWSGKKQPFYINTKNNGAVSNLPDDAFLELLCDVDMDGPKPRPVGEFPYGLRSLQMQVLDTHELTVEAIVKQDKGLLRRAMLTDPIVNSISDADAVIAELLEAEREALPEGWL